MKYTHIPAVSCHYSESMGNVLDEDVLTTSAAHFECEMMLVTGGCAQVTVNQKIYALEPKSLLFISRLERHSFVVTQQPYSRYLVTLSDDLILSNIKDIELTSIFIQRPKEFHHVVKLSDQAFGTLLPLFELMRREYEKKQVFYISRSASIVVAILIELYRAHPESFPSRSHIGMSNVVLNAQRYINDHFDEKVTLEDIARQNFVSRHALSLAFKDTVGTTFKEYMLMFRITEAKKLLVTTDLSMEGIAERIGYGNVNNFLQIFKKKEGITPYQYRKHFHAETVR